MLKILQARLQQHVNHELPDVQARFRKGRGTRDWIANICRIIEKAKEYQKNICFCFWLCQRLWLCSVQLLSRVRLFWPHEPQHTRPPCPSPTPRVHSNPCPLSRWCHPTISTSVIPSPLALNLSQHQEFFKGVSSSHQVSNILEFQLQHQSFQWTFRTDFL